MTFNEDGSIHLHDCLLNDVLSKLANLANLGFHPNPELEHEKFLLNGTLKLESLSRDEAALDAIDSLASQFGLTDYIREGKLEVLTKEQVARYPHETQTYPVTESALDHGDINELLRPYLSFPKSGIERGTVTLSQEDRTITITDTPMRIEKLVRFLESIQYLGSEAGGQ